MPKTKILTYAGIGSAALLAGLPVFLTLSPIFGASEANAEPSTIGAAATIVPNLSLSAKNVSMVMTPTGSGAVFKTTSVDATVSTNNETGYTLYFSDKDDNTSLKHANLADKAITSTENTLSGNDMLPNTWGYTLTDPAPEGENEVNNATNLGLTYSSIPTDYTTIRTRDTQTTPAETSKLTFGVKIDNSIPSGTYSDEILISAVINYSSAGYDQSKLWLDKNGARITTMQEMTPAVCASVPTPTASATGSNIPTITLTDTRDSKTYTVKKLADGNCWMTSDLALGSTTEDMTLTPEKSNVATDFTLHTVKTSADQTANSYGTDYILAGNSSNNDTYLYNWYAATAGSGTQYLISGNASQDICPRGWHLPNNDGNASWDKLLNRTDGIYKDVSSTSLASGDNPLGLHLTGRFVSGALGNIEDGYYWTRTATSSYEYAHELNFEVGGVSSHNSNVKVRGNAVRCVANDKEYMQNWSGCSDLSEGKSTTLVDSRDSKEYTVAKIGSQCWMTKNLAISDKGLNSTNSDVSSNFNLPGSTTPTFYEIDISVPKTTIDLSNDYGGYYNWYTATAGTGSKSGTAPSSICPKSWKLPTDAQFDSLITAVGSNKFTSSVFNGALAGFYNGTSRNGSGEHAYLWSSKADDASRAYGLYFNSSSAGTTYYIGTKYYGLSIRCVFSS